MIDRQWTAFFGAIFFVVAGILYVPIAAVAVYAFFPTKLGTLELHDPTLKFFVDLMGNASVIDALSNSLIAAVCSSLLSLILATTYAAYLRDQPVLIRRIVETLIYAPFFLPPIIVGLSLLLASAATGIPRGLGTIILGHTLFSLAIIYRIVSVRLGNLSVSLVHASADLGASSWQTIRFITVPHLASAFLASLLLAILLSFDETLITALVAGNTTTLPLRLWAMMRVGFSPSINALVVVVVGICMVLSLGAIKAVAKRP